VIKDVASQQEDIPSNPHITDYQTFSNRYGKALKAALELAICRYFEDPRRIL
jgi:hypothetical protein